MKHSDSTDAGRETLTVRGSAANRLVATPESRAKAQAALADARLRGATLRHDFLDGPEWERLAVAYGVRLPQWHLPATPGNVEKWVRRLGITTVDYLRWEGPDSSLSTFQTLNPDWPLRALVGMLLEQVDVEQVASTLRRLHAVDAPEDPEAEDVVPGRAVRGGRR